MKLAVLAAGIFVGVVGRIVFNGDGPVGAWMSVILMGVCVLAVLIVGLKDALDAEPDRKRGALIQWALGFLCVASFLLSVNGLFFLALLGLIGVSIARWQEDRASAVPH